ncbi:MAG: EutN/CcmL family microcompartment protein, partial [Bdellovibrionota bacterium]
MILAKVISRVVASEKLESLPKRQLLSIEPPAGFGDPTPLVAIDSVQAGPGDIVLVLQEGTGARQATLDDPSQPLPAQIAIVGI